jgi:hypothetical protein
LKEEITGCQEEMEVARVWAKAGKEEGSAGAGEELAVRKGHAYALNADMRCLISREYPALR